MPILPEIVVDIDQLADSPLINPKNRVFQEVLARGILGDVKVWSSSNSYTSLPTNGLVNLIVRGDPKTIATKLVTDPVFDQGLFEAPILMTVAQALNWVEQWDSTEQSNKAKVLDQLCRSRERAYSCLKFDRFHFSTLSIKDIVGAIDRAIVARDRSEFVVLIDRLHGQKEFTVDPYLDSL